tara:strand:+ start:363 stop:566 length:204 start_codon:yes stop_codon:yes gene_type:complete
MNIKLKAALHTIAIFVAIPSLLYGGMHLLMYLFPNPKHGALFVMGLALVFLCKVVYDIILDRLKDNE